MRPRAPATASGKVMGTRRGAHPWSLAYPGQPPTKGVRVARAHSERSEHVARHTLTTGRTPVPRKGHHTNYQVLRYPHTQGKVNQATLGSAAERSVGHATACPTVREGVRGRFTSPGSGLGPGPGRETHQPPRRGRAWTPDGVATPPKKATTRTLMFGGIAGCTGSVHPAIGHYTRARPSPLVAGIPPCGGVPLPCASGRSGAHGRPNLRM